jgi:hypothetical protein
MNVKNLISEFRNNALSTIGALSIYGDELGKPGDNIYNLKDINYDSESDELKFYFKNSMIVTLIKATNVEFNTKFIKIQNAEYIKLITNTKKLIYSKAGSTIKTECLDNHVFKINPEMPALYFYSW